MSEMDVKSFCGYRCLFFCLTAFAAINRGATVTIDDCVDGQWLDSLRTGACEQCPPCKYGDYCYKQTGICPNGCPHWYFPPNKCNRYVEAFTPYLSLSYLSDGPNVENSRFDRIEVSFHQNHTLVERDDKKYYAYYIQYATIDSDEYAQDVDAIRVQNEQPVRKDVVGLTYDTEYKFRVVLVRTFNDNLIEKLDSSSANSGRTLCRKPGMPTIESASIRHTLTDVDLKIRFGDTGCRTDNYFTAELRYTGRNGTADVRNSQEVPYGVNDITVSNLETGWTYSFYVVVSNSDGQESQSYRQRLVLDWGTYNSQTTTAPMTALTGEPDTNAAAASNDDDDDDDVIAYVSLVVALIAMLIAVAFSVMTLLLWRRLRTAHAPGTSHKSPSGSVASEIQRSTEFLASAAPATTYDQHGYLLPITSTHSFERERQTASTDKAPALPPSRDVKRPLTADYEDMSGQQREPSVIYDQLHPQ